MNDSEFDFPNTSPQIRFKPNYVMEKNHILSPFQRKNINPALVDPQFLKNKHSSFGGQDKQNLLKNLTEKFLSQYNRENELLADIDKDIKVLYSEPIGGWDELALSLDSQG